MLDTHDYNHWFEKGGKELTDRILKDDEKEKLSDVPSMLTLEGDQEVHEGKTLRISEHTIKQTSSIINTNKSRK